MTIVDAVEAFNSRYIVGSANRKAAGSHNGWRSPVLGEAMPTTRSFVGFGRTFVEAEKDMQAIFTAIRTGRVSCGGRKTPLRTYTRQSLNNTWRKIKRLTRRFRVR